MPLMGGAQRVGHLTAQPKRLLNREGATANTVRQRLSGDVLHHDVRLVLVIQHVIDGCDVGVGQCGECFGLAEQPCARIGLVTVVGQESLERDLPVESGVAGKEHFSHPAGAERPHDLVRADVHASAVTYCAAGRTRRIGKPPPAGLELAPMPTVLVVDDEANIRELLRRILEPEGYTVADAADAPTALCAMSVHSPHVVFLDVHMPGENGLWLADQIRQQFPTSATVLATADPDISTAERLRRGIIGCLLKPFSRDDVLRAAADGVQWAAALRNLQH